MARCSFHCLTRARRVADSGPVIFEQSRGRLAGRAPESKRRCRVEGAAAACGRGVGSACVCAAAAAAGVRRPTTHSAAQR